jgi:hypothetical protein
VEAVGELLQRFPNVSLRSATPLAFFNASFNPGTVEPKLVSLRKANILSVYCNPDNNCYLLSLEYKNKFYSMLPNFFSRTLSLLMTFV